MSGETVFTKEQKVTNLISWYFYCFISQLWLLKLPVFVNFISLSSVPFNIQWWWWVHISLMNQKHNICWEIRCSFYFKNNLYNIEKQILFNHGWYIFCDFSTTLTLITTCNRCQPFAYLFNSIKQWNIVNHSPSRVFQFFWGIYNYL